MHRNQLISIFDKHNPQTEMSKEETGFFMQGLMTKDKNYSCNIYDMDKESELYKHFLPLLKGFVTQIFLTRIKTMTTLRISFGTLIILMQHIESPGSAVMYTYYLHNKLPLNTLITLEILGEVFPWGFFSESQLKEIWAAQKVDSKTTNDYQCVGAPDNMIDYIEVWRQA